MSRVAIIGLGLVGRSLGLAIRRSVPDLEVVGHDRDHKRAGDAAKAGAIHQRDWNLPASLDGADLVMLAVPTGALPQVFKDITPHLKPAAIVTDMASTKADVMTLAAELLPENVSFIGGHPIVGEDRLDATEADADLLAGATYCLVASPHVAPAALDRLTALVEAIGAVPYFIDAREHDSYVAAVSHLPAVLAAVLVDTVTEQKTWSDLQQMAGGAFATATHLAARDPQLTTDLMAANRGAILDWIGRFQERLRVLSAQLETGEDLEETVMRAHRARLKWDRDRQRPAGVRLPAQNLPTSSGLMQHIMFGRLAERVRRLTGNRDDDR